MSSHTNRDIDWDAPRRAAPQAAALGYCPYSRLQVGAAGLCDDGRMVTGCNVENASYWVGPLHGVHVDTPHGIRPVGL